MMHLIGRDTLTVIKEKRQLVTEASDIGLTPGEWPDFIGIGEDPSAAEFKGFLFQKERFDGEVCWYGSRSINWTLVVLND